MVEGDGQEKGYEKGKYYIVPIAWDTKVPARFVDLTECDFSCPISRYTGIKCLGRPRFEDVKVYDKETCGVGYDGKSPTFLPVSQDELWKVEAIRKFQEALAERIHSFSILLPDGSRFEGRVKSPQGKENPPGKYVVEIVNPKTGETDGGWFDYDGQSPSVRAFITSRRPGWHIKKIRRAKSGEVPREGVEPSRPCDQ